MPLAIVHVTNHIVCRKSPPELQTNAHTTHNRYIGTQYTHSYNTFVIGTTFKDVTKFNKILTYAKLKHAFEMSQFTRFFNTNVFTHTHTNFKCMHTYMHTHTLSACTHTCSHKHTKIYTCTHIYSTCLFLSETPTLELNGGDNSVFRLFTLKSQISLNLIFCATVGLCVSVTG